MSEDDGSTNIWVRLIQLDKNGRYYVILKYKEWESDELKLFLQEVGKKFNLHSINKNTLEEERHKMSNTFLFWISFALIEAE
jgi:hypothetical protein